MRNRLFVLIAIVATGGALMAGCGSSSSSSSAAPAAATSTSGGAATSTSGGGATSTASSGGSSTSGGGVADNPAVKAAVARCKQAIEAAPTLSGDAKAKLEGLCDKAAQGDPASLRKATAEVCQEIVKETVPQSSQSAALAACPKA